MSAWLNRNRRKNPETGKIETYFSIQSRTATGKKTPQMALGFVSESEAKTLLERYKAALVLGMQPKTATGSRTSDLPTLTDWWGDTENMWPDWPDCRMKTWMDATGFQPKTIRMYDTSRRIFLPLLGHLALDHIKPVHGDQLINHLKKQGYMPRTIQIVVDHLRRGLTVAHEDGLLAAIPKLRRPRITEERTRKFLTPEQTETMLAALQRRHAAGLVDHLSVLAILMAVNLGMRRGEILSRRWQDINWRQAELTIAPVKLPDHTSWRPKTSESHRVLPLPSELLQELREAWMRAGRSEGWIFPQEDRPQWPRTNFKRALEGACKEAEVPLLYPHALRHTAATRWMWAGMDRPTALAVGGWKSTKMLDEVYSHSDRKRAAEQLQATALGLTTSSCLTELPHSTEKNERSVVKTERSN